jgi:hypothetical protein
MNVAKSLFKLQWYDLDDDLVMFLHKRYVKKLHLKIKSRYSHKNFDKLVGCKGQYYRFYYTRCRLRKKILRKTMELIGINLDQASKHIKALGYNSSIQAPLFPYKVDPLWGEILAHGFFDGYVDPHIMRYSNYDIGIRKEFVMISKRLGISNINIPANYKNDINLPSPVPRMLKSIFGTKDFYSKTCRIPKVFFVMVQRNPLFG